MNLRWVQNAGIAVPETYVLERAALSEFLDEHSLSSAVSAYLAAEPTSQAYEELRSMIRTLDLDADLAAKVDSCTSALLATHPCGIAVRSSAVVEDSKAASFAGVFESKVGLHTTREVIEAIKDVWCSQWSPRAVRYARARGITTRLNEMAVVLQAVVPAAFSESQRSGPLSQAWG